MANRLIVPEGNNAFERYQAVAVLEPGHPAVAAGLERIVEAYGVLIESALSSGQWDRARSLLEHAESVLPGSARVAA